MLNHERLTQLMYEGMSLLQSIGVTFKREPQMLKEFGDWKDCYAYATYRTYSIQISRYYLRADENSVKATIIHELVHLCDQAYNDGHGAKFRAVCRKFNKTYPGYNINHYGSQLSGSHEFSLEREAFKEAPLLYKYRVSCPECGRVWYHKRLCDSVKRAENYTCGCGHEGLIARSLDLSLVI